MMIFPIRKYLTITIPGFWNFCSFHKFSQNLPSLKHSSIFQAVDEPEFSVAYAKMCEVLRNKKVQTDRGVDLDFRKILVSRCQKEFERNYMEGFDKEQFAEKLKKAETEEKKKELQLEFEQKERRARRRSLGNIRFIGELYNLKMLTDKIMHEIIKRLIILVDVESLECLCWLFNTVGKVLDEATKHKLQTDVSKTFWRRIIVEK